AELLGDLPADLFLHRQDLGELTVELLAPKLRAGGHFHQLCLDIETVAALRDPAAQHRPNSEISPDLFGICFAPFVGEHPAPRQYAKLGQLREVVDQILSDAVTEVFSV